MRKYWNETPQQTKMLNFVDRKRKKLKKSGEIEINPVEAKQREDFRNNRRSALVKRAS